MTKHGSAVADARQRAMRLAALNIRNRQAVDIKINDDNTKDLANRSSRASFRSSAPRTGRQTRSSRRRSPALRLPSASPFRLVAFQAPGQAAGAESRPPTAATVAWEIVFSVQVDIDFELGNRVRRRDSNGAFAADVRG